MDLQERGQAVLEIEAAILARQRAHVGRISLLESDHGLNLDVLTEVHGQSILQQHTSTTELLNRYESLFTALDAGTKYLCVAGIEKRLQDGCYGFGAEPKYHYKVRAAFFNQENTKVTVEYADRTEDSAPGIFLRGIGSVIMPDVQRPDPAQPGPVRFEIANPITSEKMWGSSLDIIEASNNPMDVAHKFSMALPYGNDVGMWGHNWLDEQEEYKQLKAVNEARRAAQAESTQ